MLISAYQSGRPIKKNNNFWHTLRRRSVFSQIVDESQCQSRPLFIVDRQLKLFSPVRSTRNRRGANNYASGWHNNYSYGVCNVLRKLYNTCLNPRGYRVKVAAVVYQAWFESWSIMSRSYWKRWILYHGNQTAIFGRSRSFESITFTREKITQSELKYMWPVNREHVSLI